MVKIRLSLKGKKGQRSFWIIAIDERRKRDSGRYLEYLGFYNPGNKEVKIDQNNIQKWLKWGAQPTPIVKSLLKRVIRD